MFLSCCSLCSVSVRLILFCSQKSQLWCKLQALEKELEPCFHMFVAPSVCQFTKVLPLGDTFLRAMNFLHLETSLIFQKEYLQVSFQSQNVCSCWLLSIRLCDLHRKFQQYMQNSSISSTYLLTRVELLLVFQ